MIALRSPVKNLELRMEDFFTSWIFIILMAFLLVVMTVAVPIIIIIFVVRATRNDRSRRSRRDDVPNDQ